MLVHQIANQMLLAILWPWTGKIAIPSRMMAFLLIWMQASSRKLLRFKYVLLAARFGSFSGDQHMANASICNSS
jgi:hypothetical protein